MKSLKSTTSSSKISTRDRTISSSDSGFWTTIELLMGSDWKTRNLDNGDEIMDPSDDPRTAVGTRRKREKKSMTMVGKKINSISSLVKHLEYPSNDVSSSGPENRNLWGRAQQVMGSGHDRETMKRLQLRGREERQDAQQRRMKAREMDEMNRLKKLILSGRSPLDDCPPEMRTHPVFVFWRLVNKEIDKMNKAQVDAYFKKYRRTRRGKNSHREAPCSEEVSLVSCQEAEEKPLRLGASPGQAATPEEPAEVVSLKYEDDGIKKLRNLTTVEELYQMADKIIGIPRDSRM